MAETVEKHRTGILAWYDFSISTGKLEGIELKLLSLHDPIYAFAG